MIDLELAWQQVQFTIDTLNQLEIDYHIDTVLDMIDSHVMNICIMLPYLAEALQVDRYLEIGIRKGFSMCLVAAKRPDCTIYGFDMWVPFYADLPNPGPGFVRKQLNRIGYKGSVTFIEGDTRLTLPKFNSTKPFPIILIDGDHTEMGAYNDMKDCLKLLDGYMVVDDLQDLAVLSAWKQILNEIDCQHWQSGRVGVLYKKQEMT